MKEKIAKSEKASKSTKRMPLDYEIPSSVRAWALLKAPGVDLDAELEAIKDHQFRDAHSDWDAVVRNWCRTEQKSIDRRFGARPAVTTKPVQRMQLRSADELEAMERARGDYDVKH